MLAHFVGERGLYLPRAPRADQGSARQARAQRAPSSEGPGVSDSSRACRSRTSPITPLGRLPREKVTRALIIARLNDGTRPFYALAVHGAHISHGSYRQYRRINEIVADLEPGVPIVVAGDFNCWRPLLRVLLPGWRTLARGRTWPAQRPHSQIDHILGRGPWVSHHSFTRDGGSDHLALIADIELR